MATQFTSWNSYWAFSNAIRYRARFFHDRRVQTFLRAVTATADARVMTLKAGKALWRAQLGHGVEHREQNGQNYDEPVPYAPMRMKPLRHSAHEGRVNPRGIPCLYAANNKETAVSEVRPWLGALVSVARLRVVREIRLVNCSGDQGIEYEIYFDEPPPDERTEIVWREIGRGFSNPVTPDPGTAEYAPTQVLAEHLRHRGYDGVVYTSRLGPGFNIALFDMDAVEVNDVHLIPVKTVRYEIGEARGSYVVKHAKSDASHLEEQP
jgi:hypothetical protein